MMNRAGRMLQRRGTPTERVAGRRLRAAATVVPPPLGSAPATPPPSRNYATGGRVDGSAVRGHTRGKLA